MSQDIYLHLCCILIINLLHTVTISFFFFEKQCLDIKTRRQNLPVFLFPAEEKLKDKLAAAARGKLTQANKEKQIQMERKRKAAMFLSMLKSSEAAGAEEPAPSVDLPPPFHGKCKYLVYCCLQAI